MELSTACFNAMVYKVGRVDMGFLYPKMYTKNFADYRDTREGFNAAKAFKSLLKWATITLMSCQALFNIVTSITSATYLHRNNGNYTPEEVADRLKDLAIPTNVLRAVTSLAIIWLITVN